MFAAMRYVAPAIAFLLACSSGNKQPATPTPPDTGMKADPTAGDQPAGG